MKWKTLIITTRITVGKRLVWLPFLPSNAHEKDLQRCNNVAKRVELHVGPSSPITNALNPKLQRGRTKLSLSHALSQSVKISLVSG